MSKATILKILQGAKALLEKGWCQGSYAQLNGKTVQASNKYATHFDLLGALHRAAGKNTIWSESIWDSFDPEISKNPGRWNDHLKRTQAQVVAAVDAAIVKFKETDDEN